MIRKLAEALEIAFWATCAIIIVSYALSGLVVVR